MTDRVPASLAAAISTTSRAAASRALEELHETIGPDAVTKKTFFCHAEDRPAAEIEALLRSPDSPIVRAGISDALLNLAVTGVLLGESYTSVRRPGPAAPGSRAC